MSNTKPKCTRCKRERATHVKRIDGRSIYVCKHCLG